MSEESEQGDVEGAGPRAVEALDSPKQNSDVV